MLSEILSPDKCAECRVCCVFDRSDAWEMPLITPELSEKLKSNFPHIKLRKPFDNSRCKVTEAEFDENGLCACPMLTEKGCALGDDKPFDCRIWPFRVMKRGNLLLLTLSPVCEYVSSLSVKEVSRFVPKIAPKIFEEAERNPEMMKEYIEGYPIFAVKEQ